MEMAFNPFHRFRKHQKALMAAMAVMCMIIFVFQFGAGDVFTRALAWFGASRGRGEVVTTLYGDKIREGELDKLKRNRLLAHEFMTRSAIPIFLVNAVQDIAEKLRKDKADLLAQDTPVMQIAQDFLQRNHPQFGMSITPEQRAAGIQANLRMIRDQFQLPSISKSADQVRMLETLATAIGFEGWQFAPENRPPNDGYFGPRLRTEDLLDFLIWKHQADKLGIELSDSDIIRELNRAAGNRTPPLIDPDEAFERSQAVVSFIAPGGDRDRRATPGATTADLLQALRDEFRVQLAKEAILGHGSGARAYRNEAEPVRMTPAAATPDEFLAYFRDQRTTLAVAFLPIPVKAFVKDVTGEPSKQELANRYNDNKDREYSPDSPTPGFRDPRRMTLQYLSANPESNFYKEQGRKMAEALGHYSNPAHSAAFRVAAGFTNHAAGGWPAWVSQVALPEVFDPLRQEYERYLSAENRHVADGFTSPFDLRDRMLPSQQPAFAASVLGQFLAGTEGTISQIGGLATLPGADAAYRQAAWKACSNAVLAGGTGSPLLAVVMPSYSMHSYRPREEVQAKLLEGYEKDRAEELMWGNLRTLVAELTKLRDKPDEAKKYVAGKIKEFGLENFHTTAGLEARYQLAADAEFKPLQEAWKTQRPQFFPPFLLNILQSNLTKEQIQQFGFGLPPLVDLLFATNLSKEQIAQLLSIHPALLDLLFQQSNLNIPGFQGIPFQSDKSTWLFWKTEDKPAHSRPPAEVEKEVRDSWYLDKARALAAKKAEQILKIVKEKHPADEEQVRSLLREYKVGEEPFELRGIAQQLPADEFLVGGRNQFRFKPYAVPEDKIAYPPTDFVDRLLKLKEPGDARLMADRPVAHFYIAVLLVRAVPLSSEFFSLYEVPAVDDPLWQGMMAERVREYHLDLLKQMRAEAGKVDADGNLVIDERFKKGSSGQSEE
jgi:hypothetical protein